MVFEPYTLVDACWSDRLARWFLAGISEPTLTAEWNQRLALENGLTGSPASALRETLRRSSQRDADVREWIIQLWRRENDDLVDATEFVSHEVLGRQASELLARFAADSILLAIIANDSEPSPNRVANFLQCVTSRRERRILQTAWARMTTDDIDHPFANRTIVILGGHHRDASRLVATLRERFGGDIRWESFDKNRSGTAGRSEVARFVRHADIAIVITGEIAHPLVAVIKDVARRSRIPCRFITKASERQLLEIVNDLAKVPNPQFDKE
jgi:hypothetical protein